MRCAYCQAELLTFQQPCPICGAHPVSAPITISIPALEPRSNLQHGRYQLRGQLGSGAFGITYKALHKATLEIVTIKEHCPADLLERNPNGRLHPRAGCELEYALSLQRFEREAQALALCRHPSIVGFHESFAEHATAYLVLEYLEGETLEARLAGGHLLSVAEASVVLRQLLSALHTIHSAGMLHRDIKPANILLTSGRAVLVDFGAITPAGTRATTRLLTPAYAALEQYSTSAVLTPQTDLYALSATIFEALSGRAPPPVLERASGAALPSLRSVGVPAALSATLERALSLRIADRPSSASAMLTELGLSLELASWGPNSRAV